MKEGVTPSSLDRLKTRTTARMLPPHERSLKKVIMINLHLKGVFDHFLFTSFRSRVGQLLGREGGRLPVRWEGGHDAVVQGWSSQAGVLSICAWRGVEGEPGCVCLPLSYL